MNPELITHDEIKRLKTNPRQLSWKDMTPGKGLAIPITPIELKSGYFVSYTIDDIFNQLTVKIEHVIVGANKFEPDPADMDEIAHLMLGDCFRAPAEWGIDSEGLHYLRIMGLNRKDFKKFREEGIERGVAVIEGRR